MNYLYALLLISAGGILPLISIHAWKTMRLIGSACTAVGCTIGFALAVIDLYSGTTASFPFQLGIGLPFSFAIDQLATFFLVPLFLIGAAASCYSYHYLDKQEQRVRIAAHYLFQALLILSMSGVILADSIISFAFCWEAMSVASAILVLFEYEEETNRRAAFRYFLYTQAGGLFIFVAFGLMYSASGTFALVVPEGLSQGVKMAIFFLAMVGFGSKAGLVPLHVWLPHAHPAAPSHISALMSGVMIKLGIYGILRMFLIVTPDPFTVSRIFVIIGAVSGVYGIIQAIGQKNIKRLLAYSSIENVGIIFLGLGIGLIGLANGNNNIAALGFSGGLLHIWNHALFKSILFFGAGAVLHGTDTLILDRLGGLFKKMPKTGVMFLIGSVSICGLPPLNGFVSEFFIYAAGFYGAGERGVDLLFIVLTILSLAAIGGLAVACFTKVFGIVFLGECRSENIRHSGEVKSAMLVSMAVLVLFCFAIGIVPAAFIYPSLSVAGMITKNSLPQAVPVVDFCRSISLGSMGFICLVFLLFLFRRVLYRNKVVATGPTWGCGFTMPTVRMQYTASSYARSILLFFKPFTRVTSQHKRIDDVFPASSGYRSTTFDIVEQFGERYIAGPLDWLADHFRAIQHGDIQLYIAYIVLAVIVLLLFQVA